MKGGQVRVRQGRGAGERLGRTAGTGKERWIRVREGDVEGEGIERAKQGEKGARVKKSEKREGMVKAR